MLRSRLPAAPRQSRRTPPELPPSLSAARGSRSRRLVELLLHSWPGRLFIVAAALKLVVALMRQRRRPFPVRSRSSAAPRRSGSCISVGYFVWRLFVLMKRRLLWRVRRKLILSYIFIGVVPALLIIAFFMLGAWVVSINVSAYLFRDGYDDIVNDAELAASARRRGDRARPGATARDGGARAPEATSRALSRAVDRLPAVGAGGPALVRAGRMEPRRPAARRIPAWVRPRGGFIGTVVGILPADSAATSSSSSAPSRPSRSATRRLGSWSSTCRSTAEMLERLYEATGVKAGAVRARRRQRRGGAAARWSPAATATASSRCSAAA